MKVTMDLTRENMIRLLLSEFNLNNVESNIYMDISQCNSLDEVKNMSSLIDFDLDSFKNYCVEKYVEREKKINEWNKLMFHELEELGESLGLWKTKIKQKKLIKK